MIRYLFLGLCSIALISCADASTQKSQGTDSGWDGRARALMQDEDHTRRCNFVFDQFRENARIGMTSVQFASAVNTEWVEQARIMPIVVLGGEIPIDFRPESSICYCIHLYPNEEDWSNYVIYLRISRPHDLRAEEYADFGKQFLKGAATQDSVVLEQFALCPPGKTLQEASPTERFPKDGSR